MVTQSYRKCYTCIDDDNAFTEYEVELKWKAYIHAYSTCNEESLWYIME